MRPVFADSFYFLALFNPTDQAHFRAARFEASDASIVTTAWVLTEVADAFCAPVNRHLFLRLLETLGRSPDARIISPSDELFERGVELYRERPDKDWPLTDCISFAVMREENISEALTADRHFEQAGFQLLLK